MRSTPLSFGLATASFALLLSAVAPSANAQCGVNTLGFGNAGIVTDNPFHAEVVVTRSGQASSIASPRFSPPS